MGREVIPTAQMFQNSALKQGVRRGRLNQASQRLLKLLLCLLKRPLRFLCALQRSAHSFCGHIRELLSRKYWAIDLGPHFEVLPDGSIVENSRTECRSLGTEALRRSRPWANTVELAIFLQGFDWGEQYALRKFGMEVQTGGQTSKTPHAFN
jgi:hypothetical protein